MSWSGEFVFGETWAAYRGPAAQNAPHAHAAIQLAIGCGADVTVEDRDGRARSGRALLIKPRVVHALVGEGVVALVYLEPQSPTASSLLSQVGPAELEPFPADIETTAPPDEWLATLARSSLASRRPIDARLSQALDLLAETPGRATIRDTARRCGLSDSRLRTLAREQLGLPLSTWLLWRKLERAARELAAGASLSDAASAGGFADQAHFTRTMRRMFGITPAEAADTLT